MAIPQDKGISQSIHQNKALARLSVAFKQAKLIAQDLSPTYPVVHESDNYYVYDTDNLRLEETIRANGAESNQVKFALSTASYKLQEHALSDIITKRDRDNADEAINLDADTTENLTEKILLRIEEDLQEVVLTKANWAQNHSLSTTCQWSLNTTLSDPIVDINTATTVIALATGKEPNVVQVNFQTFVNLRNHTAFVDRIKYTSPESVTEALIARLLNVERLLIGRAIQNTAPEGLPASNAFVWTDSAFIGFIERNPGLKKVSALYTFRKTDRGNPWSVKKWDEPKKDGQMIEVGTMYEHKIICSTCGYVVVDTNA